ncbi:TPA: histidine phosphatase family protein [Clostridioides difficile]|nr:histidine phosphatase family protein [Clostridioides difficile]
MDKTVTFYIVRHGETLLNQLHRAQGWCDSPLTENGINSAIHLGHELSKIYFKAAFCSDTMRAFSTTELVLSSCGQSNIKIKTDKRLREWCLGNWEAEYNHKFISDVLTTFPMYHNFNDLNLHLDKVCNFIFKTDTTGLAETFEIIINRLINFFKEIGNSNLINNGSNILVTTHAFVIKTLVYLFSKEMLNSLNKIENATYLCAVWDGKKITIKNR